MSLELLPGLVVVVLAHGRVHWMESVLYLLPLVVVIVVLVVMRLRRGAGGDGEPAGHGR